MPKFSALPADIWSPPQPCPWTWNCRAVCLQRWPCAKVSVEGFVTLLPPRTQQWSFSYPGVISHLVFGISLHSFLLSWGQRSAKTAGAERDRTETSQGDSLAQGHIQHQHPAEGSTGNAPCPCPRGHGSPYSSQEGPLSRMTTRTDTGTSGKGSESQIQSSRERDRSDFPHFHTVP